MNRHGTPPVDWHDLELASRAGGSSLVCEACQRPTAYDQNGMLVHVRTGRPEC